MKESTALKLIKMLPKKFVEEVEIIFFHFAEACVQYEAGLLNEEQAQHKMSSIIKEGIQKGLVTESNMKDFEMVAEDAHVFYDHLKKKHKM